MLFFKTEQQQLDFKIFTKNFLTLFIPISLTILIFGISVYRNNSIDRLTILQENSKKYVSLLEKIIKHHIKNSILDLNLLSNHTELLEFLDNPNPLQLRGLKKEYFNFAKSTNRYDQIHFLDSTGKEIVRITYKENNPYQFPDNKLLDQSHEYYFKKTYELSKGNLFVSPLHLNVKKEEIEIPYKPILRISTPVFDAQGNKKGVVSLNYLAGFLINEIKEMSTTLLGNIMLVNSTGHWLIHPDSSKEWGFMFPDKETLTFKNWSKNAWSKINQEKAGQFIDTNGLFTYITSYPFLEENQASPESQKNSVVALKIITHIPSLTKTSFSITILALRFFGNYFWIFLLLGLGIGLFIYLSMGQKITKKEKEKFSHIVENSPTSVIITDSEGKIEYVNPFFTKTTGYTLDEVLGRNPRIFNSGEHKQELYQKMWNTIKTGNMWKGILHNRKKNNDLYWERTAIYPLKNDRNEIIHYIAIKEDITQRLNITESLRREKKFSKTMLSTITDGVDIVDENFNIIYMNENFKRIFGNQSIGKKCYTVYRNNQEQCKGCPLHKPIETGETKEITVDKISGNRIFILKCTGMELPNGKKVILEIFKDITEEKRLEKELNESKNHYKDLYNYSKTANFSIGINGKIKQSNSQAEALLGYSLDELIEKEIASLYNDTENEKASTLFEKLKNGEHLQNEKLEMQTKNGEIIFVVLSAYPIFNEEGKVVEIFSMVTDITEQKNTKKELTIKNSSIKSSLNAIALTALDGKVISVNEAFLKIWKYDSINEPIGKNIFELFSKPAPNLIQSLQKEKTYNGEGKALCKDRSLKDIQFSVNQIEDKNGNPLCITAAFIDISKLTQTTSDLGKTQEKFRTYIEHSPTAIFIIDKNGSYQSVNQAACQITGFSGNELLNMSIRDLTSAEQIDSFLEKFNKLLSTKKLNTELSLLKNNGQKVDVIITATELSENNYIMFCIDITAQKEAEKSLANNNARLQAVLQTLPDTLLFIINKDGRFIDCYIPESIPFSTPLNKIIDAQLDHILPPDVANKIAYLVQETLQTTMLQTMEYSLELPTGRRYFNARITPATADSVVILSRDITEYKHTKEILEQKSHDLDEKTKELNCLYNLAELAAQPHINLDELYQKILELIPSSWQYPEITCAKLSINDKNYKTENYLDTKWKQASYIYLFGQRSGTLEVAYLEEREASHEGPFLKEEQHLLDTLAEQLGKITEQKQIEETLEQKSHDLDEKTKELNCLYNLAKIAAQPHIPLDKLYQKIIELIPSSWQYPEITCAKLSINDKNYKTENYLDTRWKQASYIYIFGQKSGILEIAYIEERSKSQEGPFLKEERHLLDTLAEQLGKITEQRQIEQSLEQKSHDLDEKTKELNCLYNLSKLAAQPYIPLNELYQKILELIPSSWQYPEITCAKLSIKDEKYKTENHLDTKWKQTSYIYIFGQKSGVIEVAYLEEKKEVYEGPFLKEERLLLDTLAAQLGKITEQKQIEKSLNQKLHNQNSNE